MSRAFDAYYSKAIGHEWHSHHRALAHKALVETEETIIRSYNDIWQPAADFIQERMSNLPPEAESSHEKWFLEALQGVLMDNQIKAEEAKNMDNKTLRQKLDGFISKIDSMLEDAPKGEVSSYIETFSKGLKSFKNRVDVEGGEPAPPLPAPGEPPAPGAPASPAPPAPGPEGAAPPAPGPAQPPAQDQNSADTLLKDLNLS